MFVDVFWICNSKENASRGSFWKRGGPKGGKESEWMSLGKTDSCTDSITHLSGEPNTKSRYPMRGEVSVQPHGPIEDTQDLGPNRILFKIAPKLKTQRI